MLYTKNDILKKCKLAKHHLKKLDGLQSPKKITKGGKVYDGYDLAEAKELLGINTDDDDLETIASELDTADPLQIELLKANIRAKEAQADKAELDNEERRGLLVPAKNVEKFIYFQASLFAEKLKELIPETEGERFNSIVKDIINDIETFLKEEGLDDIISENSLEDLETVFHREPEYMI